MKAHKKLLFAVLTVLTLAVFAFSQGQWLSSEHLLIGNKGDIGLRRLGPATICASDGGVNCNGILSQSVYVAADYTNATTGFTDVTGLALPVVASQSYNVVCRIIWQGSAGTTGPKYQFTGPGSPTSVAVGMNSVVTATTVIAASATALSSAVANTGTVTTATNFPDTVTLGLINGANAGTVKLQAAANGAGTLTIKAGSSCAFE